MPTTSKPITTSAATQQARRIADRVMPGRGPSVQVYSNRSHDLTTDTPLIITQIAHPPMDEGCRVLLVAALQHLAGAFKVEQFAECTIVTRDI